VHYEAAFESYLQAKGWPYVVVDEAKKAIFSNVSIKSFDFLVYSTSQRNLLVDVKGRKFPAAQTRSNVRAFENWVTREDVDSLQEWENIFGADFQAVLVFAYWLQGSPEKSPFEDVHFFKQRYYAFAAVPMSQYSQFLRPRSESWQTVAMPAAQFQKAIRDIGSLL
jgi:hypothetical protein